MKTLMSELREQAAELNADQFIKGLLYMTAVVSIVIVIVCL